MRKQRSRHGYILYVHVVLLVSFFAFGATATASADGTTQPTFSQRILPLNCVFTVINAGTGDLYYLTPAECGVALTPPTTPTNPVPTVSQLVVPGTARPVFFVPATTGAASSNAGGVLPIAWKPIANAAQPTLKRVASKKPHLPVAVVGGGMAILLVVALVVFLL